MDLRHLLLLFLSMFIAINCQDIPSNGDPCYGFIAGMTPDPPEHLQLEHSIVCEDGGLRYDYATSPLHLKLWARDGDLPFRLCFKGADQFTEIYQVEGGNVTVVDYPPEYTETPEDKYCQDSKNDVLDFLIIPPPGVRYVAMVWWKAYELEEKRT